jgi:hypothetical protein
MNVALGFKAHSGWAASIVLVADQNSLQILDRRRVELAHEQWGRQPYHAAEQLEPQAARNLVARGVRAANKHATREVKAAIKRMESSGHKVVTCAVLTGAAMPDWSADEILAVHFRMHKAEGVLFRDALVEAAIACGLRVAPVPEKSLMEWAVKALKKSENDLMNEIVALGKRSGPPWGKDQKQATLAAMIALSQMSDEL